jgi:outer membrane immunogenic protein
MKHLLGGLAVAAMIAGPAMAADMPAKAPVYKAVPPPVIYDPWTGFYLGANGGYSWARWESSSPAAIFPTATGLRLRQARMSTVGLAACKRGSIGVPIPAGS